MAAGDHLFVVSGCSGSGKSTLIAALEQHGGAVAAEPGRQVVSTPLWRCSARVELTVRDGRLRSVNYI